MNGVSDSIHSPHVVEIIEFVYQMLYLTSFNETKLSCEKNF